MTREKEEVVSSLRLFCALMLVRNSQATLEQAVELAPLVGETKALVDEMFLGRNRQVPGFGLQRGFPFLSFSRQKAVAKPLRNPVRARL